MKPLLFLDVDGVINALDKSLDGEMIERKGFKIRFQPWLRECLLRLHEHFEVVWCTTWEEEAESCFAEVLGLPGTRPYVNWRQRMHDNRKLPHLLEYAGNRPFAWLDDMATMEFEELGYRPDAFRPNLIVVPDDKVGLTPAHTDQLIAFAESMTWPRKCEGCGRVRHADDGTICPLCGSGVYEPVEEGDVEDSAWVV